MDQRGDKDIISTFAKCFRLLAKIEAGIKNGFFLGLINFKSEELLISYIKFLQMRGETLAENNRSAPQQLDDVAKRAQIAQGAKYVAQKDILQNQDVAKYFHIAQRSNYVAQCGTELVYKINSLTELFGILRHLGLVKLTASLLLEKNLLCLESLILDFKKQPIRTGLNTETAYRPPFKTVEKKSSQNLGQTHNKIADFISSKERVQNVEIFARFTNIARRTLKRKLSELAKAGAIKRIAVGKRVFYAENSTN